MASEAIRYQPKISSPQMLGLIPLRLISVLLLLLLMGASARAADGASSSNRRLRRRLSKLETEADTTTRDTVLIPTAETPGTSGTAGTAETVPFRGCASTSQRPTTWDELVVASYLNSSAWSDTLSNNTSPGSGSSAAAAAAAASSAAADGVTLEPAWERFAVCSGGKGPFRVTITPRRIGTTWKGWGTSLAWLGNYIGEFPQANRDQLLDLMFRPESGLGFNIVRFNIGGGSLPRYSSQLYSDPILRWRAMPGYWPSESSGFNWTADGNQQAMLLGAKDRGVNIFEAFSYSPPWWMTKSKDVAGASELFHTNLQKRYERKFVKYLVEVVERFKTDPALGNIEFDTLEPFNEALEGIWVKGGSQEGCNYNIHDMGRIILETAHQLKKRNLKTKVAGVDSFTSVTTVWLPQLLGKEQLHRVNVHAYTLPLQMVVPNMTVSTAERISAVRYTSMKAVAKSLGKEIWVSESGPLNRYGSLLDLSLYMMRNVIETVNILQAAAYVYWQAFDVHEEWSIFGLNWYYPPGYTGRIDPPTKLKRFWMFKQFTDLARPGSEPLVVLEECQHTVAAFYSRENRAVSVFIVNQRAEDKEVDVGLSGFTLNVGGTTQVQIRRTTISEDNAESTLEITGEPNVLVVAQGQTFTSVTFTNVEQTALS